MRILTEQELRDLYRIEPYETFALPVETRLTPAARQFLVDRRIPILEEQAVTVAKDKKSEATTHLNAHEVVVKSHPKIRFRGLIDGLYAELLELEFYLQSKASTDLYESIKVIRKYVGRMMTSDATGKKLDFIDYNGWSPEEIRQRSHTPERYYGVGHFRAHPQNGALMLKLNTLRTHIRFVEIAAIEAFTNSNPLESERPDLILALNRMSSLVYILMCELRAKEIQGGNNHHG